MVPPERRTLFEVVVQGLGFMTFGGMPARFQDTPPGHTASVVAHHRPHLPGSTGAQELGDVPVGHCGSRRDQPDDCKDRLDILIPH